MTARFLCVVAAFTLQTADLLSPSSAEGQRLAPQLTPVPMPNLMSPVTLRFAAAGILGRGDKDHRYTGFYIGLVVGAGVGAYALTNCSGDSDCERGAGAITIASMSLCAAAGALVGALMRK